NQIGFSLAWLPPPPMLFDNISVLSASLSTTFYSFNVIFGKNRIITIVSFVLDTSFFNPII
ncbi:MAG: hypothetical protein L6371_05820, partial [Candidatus Atribacteria bacterium]|nr:hypothetical protein [Candidatus Atribacteria bacterium]